MNKENKINNECVFCKIIKGEIKQDILYEDKDTAVLLDISPASKKGGHCLVMPKKHYELFSDIPESELEPLMKTIQKATKAVLKFGEGANIIQNNKRVAGQFVPHVHFHVIPRFEGDNICVEKWEVNKYKDGEMREVAKKLKQFFKD